MKKLVFLVLSFLFASSTVSATGGFPSFPMSIWGTLKDGQSNIAPWAVVKFLDSNITVLVQYTTTWDGQFGGVGATEVIPTLQAFAGNLSMQVVYQGNTFTIDADSIDDTNRGANCPAKSAITFVSSVCRYDLNIAKKIGTLTGTTTNTGSVVFSGATTSGIVLNSPGTLILASLTGASNVSLPTNLTITASGSWDGYFHAPEQTSAIGNIVLAGYTRANALTYAIGSDVASLTLSGAVASITLTVGSQYNGKIMKVYRSEDQQQTHIYLADCLVSNSQCTFTTNKFSTFSILEPTDTTPNDFTFTSATNQELSTSVNSSAVTITGVSAPTNVAATNGLFQINSSGSWLTNGTVNNGDTLIAKVTSSASYSSTTSVSIVVGTVTKVFTVTTKTAPASWGGGGGGGGSTTTVTTTTTGATSTGTTTIDSCPNGDFSLSKTDGVCVGPAQITTNSIQKITMDGALFGGTITSSGGLAVTERGMIYSTWPNPIINSGATIKVPNRSGKDVYIYNVASLTSGTTYYVKAYAINSMGIAYGNEVSFSTLTTGGVSLGINAQKNLPKTIADLKFMDIAGSWAYDYIVKLSLRGVINNGEKFSPNNNTIRAEFIKMMVGAIGGDIATIDRKTPFADVTDSSWFAPYVSYAVKNNLINATLKNFRPNDTITREEAMKILALSLKLDIDTFTSTSFADVANDSWFAKYIEAVKERQIISGQTIDGKLIFRPKDEITRAEIAKILAKQMQ